MAETTYADTENEIPAAYSPVGSFTVHAAGIFLCQPGDAPTSPVTYVMPQSE